MIFPEKACPQPDELGTAGSSTRSLSGIDSGRGWHESTPFAVDLTAQHVSSSFHGKRKIVLGNTSTFALAVCPAQHASVEERQQCMTRSSSCSR